MNELSQKNKILLNVIKENPKLAILPLRDIAKQVDGFKTDHPESVKYALNELSKRNLIDINRREKFIRVNKRGYQKTNSKIYYLPIVSNYALKE